MRAKRVSRIHKKTGKKRKAVNIKFGERSEEKKINKISSGKSAKKITNDLKKLTYGKVPPKQVVIKIKSGYSPRYAKRLEKKGISADEYFYTGYAYPVDEVITPAAVRKFAAEKMDQHIQKYEQTIQATEAGTIGEAAATGEAFGASYELEGEPRISEIEIEYIYDK